jgi:pyruvate dehydrogenase E2 component (dihydrolipoamide acetyltransferase)
MPSHAEGPAERERELVIPPLGDGIADGTVLSIRTPTGTGVSEGEVLLEIETDKVVMEVTAPAPGVLLEYLVAVGQRVSAGLPYARLRVAWGDMPREVADAAAEPRARAAQPDAPMKLAATEAAGPAVPDDAPVAVGAAPVPAGPSARRLARELGIAIGEVPGVGPRGRIDCAAVKRHARTRLSGTAHVPVQLPEPEVLGAVRAEPLSGIARSTARNMQLAWGTIPHAWLQEQADLGALETARALFRERVPGLTLSVILCKALALAMCRHPRFNSVFDESRQQLLYREEVNVGVAVDTPRGLLVPVLRNADQRSIPELAAELAALARRAKEGRLGASELRGGGMTLSNLGGIGTTGMWPLVNWPEVAILGVSATREEAGFAGERLVRRRLLPLTLGFDHRVINGADGARFLRELREVLENPAALAFA